MEQLEDLASEEVQVNYEKNVPIANVPSEMIWLWSSVAYHPDDPYFRSCFDREELDVLAAFNELFDSRVVQLPEPQGTIRTWLASPVWREIMCEAQRTRERIVA